MHEKLEKLEKEAESLINSSSSESELESIRVKLLGKKGELTELLRSVGTLPAEERPIFGRKVNELKERLDRLIRERLAELKRPEARRRLDLSLPGRAYFAGSLHPINIIIDEVVRIFTSMGFEIAGGPEIESEYYNFDALNTPEDHPARDIQDTFYLQKKGYLLRTHTSPVQIRVMESQRPPVRIIAPGKCFRRDAIDATHFICFHQVEGLYVDRDVSLADLKGVLTVLARELFRQDVKIRFRPHFFPFTEPSVEYDFSCTFCGGKGCKICKNTGWIEISGAGMVHPEVFKAVGYDPERWQGYAFGMGIERIAMIKFGIDDIRLFYENDLRFLSQFRGVYP
jgi:phenylalanyl-tRNA synthetase alpha chain